MTLEAVYRALSFVRLEPFPQYGYVQRQALLSQIRADARDAAAQEGAVEAGATAAVPSVDGATLVAASAAAAAASASPVIADATLRGVVQRSVCGLLALQALQQEQLLAQPAVATQVSRQAARTGGKKGGPVSRAPVADADDDGAPCVAAATSATPIDSRVISSSQAPTLLRAWAASMIQRKSLKDIVTFFTRPIESAMSLPHIDLEAVVEGLLASAKWDLARGEPPASCCAALLHLTRTFLCRVDATCCPSCVSP